MDIKEFEAQLNEHGFSIVNYEEYKDYHSKFTIEKDGYKYYINRNCIIKTWNPKKWGVNNPYSIENLKLYLKQNNYKCKLESEIYDNNLLKLRCECGEKYSCSLSNLINKKQDTCRKCSIIRRNQLHLKPINYYNDFLEKYQLTPLEDGRNVNDYYYYLNKDGYYLFLSMSNANSNQDINNSMFISKNKYAINNMENYIKLNGYNVELLTTEYHSAKDKVEFRCGCGRTFKKLWYTFVSSKYHCCSKCMKEITKPKRIKYTEDLFLKYNIQTIEKYNGVSNYIYCKDNNGYILYIKPSMLKDNDINIYSTLFHTCNKYSFDNLKLYLKLNNINTELLDKEYHGTKSIYHWKCSCGNKFTRSLYYFLQSQYKCRGCTRILERSKMEENVIQYLDELKIINYREKTFEDCKDKHLLPFDFYLPDKNICIECQGKQHFISIEYFGGEERLQYTKLHDKIKRDYCEKNGIILIELNYDEFNDNTWKEKLNIYVNG